MTWLLAKQNYLLLFTDAINACYEIWECLIRYLRLEKHLTSSCLSYFKFFWMIYLGHNSSIGSSMWYFTWRFSALKVYFNHILLNLLFQQILQHVMLTFTDVHQHSVLPVVYFKNIFNFFHRSDHFDIPRLECLRHV